MSSRTQSDAISAEPPVASLSAVVAVLWVALAATAASQSAGFWSFLPPDQIVRRCAADSDASGQASARLEALHRRIAGLEDTAAVTDLVAELHGLLRSECFRLASETPRVPSPDSSRSLKAWWLEAGGRDWLASYLENTPASALPVVSDVVVPPDTRRTLSLEARRDHPLAVLLCRAGDAECGAETRGWTLRANAHFAAHRALGRDAPSSFESRPSTDAAQVSEDCAASAGESGPDRYRLWRQCVEARRPQQVALPLGGFKAPRAGWLVVAGRRGHYTFCDSTRAYNLASGTALVDESCSGLSLKANGRVDSKATDRARVDRTARGRVVVDNLREALWMMALRGETEEVQLEAGYYPLPPGMLQQWRPTPTPVSSADRLVSVDTSQTQLAWRWTLPDGAALVGVLTWPASYDAAEDHAVQLLRVAEESWTEGCDSEWSLPPAVIGRAVIRMNDLPDGANERLEQALVRASPRWKALPACGPSSR